MPSKGPGEGSGFCTTSTILATIGLLLLLLLGSGTGQLLAVELELELSFGGREMFSGRPRGNFSWDLASFDSVDGFREGGFSETRANVFKLVGLNRSLAADLERIKCDDEGDPTGLMGALDEGLLRLLLLPWQ